MSVYLWPKFSQFQHQFLLTQNVLWESLWLHCEAAVPDAAMQKERYESFPAYEFSVLKQTIWADYAQNHKYSKEFNFHG